ncbi:MAG: hypothetical protein ACREJ4_13920, partial [Candidatus Methylomirabilaceae bacterium]
MSSARKEKATLKEKVMMRMATLDRRPGLKLAAEEGYSESEVYRRILGLWKGKDSRRKTIALRRRYDALVAEQMRKS